jgi:hypothetical protein
MNNPIASEGRLGERRLQPSLSASADMSPPLMISLGDYFGRAIGIFQGFPNLR